MSPTTKSLNNLNKTQGASKAADTWRGKNPWKRMLDLALYLVACVTAGTGLLLAYRLPHGAGNANRVIFLGYGRHEWGDIHTWIAFLGIILVMVHLVLNWQWLVKVAASKHIWRLARRYPLGAIDRCRFLFVAGRRSRTEQGKRCHSSGKRAVTYAS
jgi:Domain of unknown function (DUF4405)